MKPRRPGPASRGSRNPGCRNRPRWLGNRAAIGRRRPPTTTAAEEPRRPAGRRLVSCRVPGSNKLLRWTGLEFGYYGLGLSCKSSCKAVQESMVRRAKMNARFIFEFFTFYFIACTLMYRRLRNMRSGCVLYTVVISSTLSANLQFLLAVPLDH
jgi:hypothetical protein